MSPSAHFCTSTTDGSGPTDALKAAGLPLHHSPHDLRHTWASLLLQQGESIQHVQRMLGNASIALTVDTCGKWPMGNKAAVNGLGPARVPKLVAIWWRKAPPACLTPQKLSMVLVTREGLEPSTQRLRVSCSTIELPGHGAEFPL